MRMDSPEDLLKLGNPDPEQTALLEKLGPLPPPNFDDMPAMRAQGLKRYEDIIAALGPPEPHCTESDVEIPLRDGGKAMARVWKPGKPDEGGSPLAVLLYGGGFITGEVQQMTMYARDLCRQYGATVVAPTYRLAPEHPWPAAPHDAWDTVNWAADHAKELGASTARGFIVGGVSAGGNLAAVVGTRWVEEKQSPPLTGLWLCVPFVFGKKEQIPEEYRELYLSMAQNNDGPVLSQQSMDKMREFYAADPTDSRYAPALRRDAIDNMPPVYFQVCGMDPLRDDAIIYDKMLRQANRQTLMHMYPGLVHAGWAFFPGLKLSRQARIDFVLGFGWLLSTEPREDPDAGQAWVSAGA